VRRPAPSPSWPSAGRHRHPADRRRRRPTALRKSSGFFAPDTIAADTYKGVGAVKTLAVGAQWVTSDKADANTVYEITKALFSDAAQKTLAAGHAKGKFITKENAVKGAGIPFHPGAEKFYKEAGLLK
jgi:TRAP transporter TAXI family solute receptor